MFTTHTRARRSILMFSIRISFCIFLVLLATIRSLHDTTFQLYREQQFDQQLLAIPSVMTLSTSSLPTSCIGLNSKEWLERPRYDNIALYGTKTKDVDDDLNNKSHNHHDDHPHSHSHEQLILTMQNMFESSDYVQELLFQTMCPKESKFTSWLLHNSSNDTDNDHDIHNMSRSMDEEGESTTALPSKNTNTDNNRIVRLWSVRLTYLALYYHQHRLAIPEAQVRMQQQKATKNNSSSSSSLSAAVCQSELDQYNIGAFDYECPNAKYLIMSPGGNGIGANVRAGFVVSLLLGLALDRIVIFPSNIAARMRQSPDGTITSTNTSFTYHNRSGIYNEDEDDTGHHNGWILASCHRRDHQCFFMPTTPCTLTLHDIEHAYVLTKEENRKLRRYFEFPKEHKDTKVVQFTSPMFIHKNTPSIVRKRLYAYAQFLLQSVPSNDPRLPLMQKGADSILNDEELYNNYGDNNREKTINGEMKKKTKQKQQNKGRVISSSTSTATTYNYRDDYLRIHRALMFYVMRPNPINAQRMDTLLTEILPSNFTPATSVGLPIRGSDKCLYESECLTFHQHMQVVNQMWGDYYLTKSQQPKELQLLQANNETIGSIPTYGRLTKAATTTGTSVTPSIIFTTESKLIRQDQHDFVTNITKQQHFPYQFLFITNPKDVTQDSGYMKDVILRHKQQQQARQKKNTIEYGNDGTSFIPTPDDIMLSSMTSLKLQLMPRLSIGNCCSNFHVLIQDYLIEGGGGSHEGNEFMCLQENPNMEFRICCKWSKDCRSEKGRIE